MLIKNKAFSLVETIIASIIFMIAAAGAFKVFSMAQKVSTVSQAEVVAANYGRQLLEDLRTRVDQRAGVWPLNCNGALNDWPSSPPVGHPFQGTVKYVCSQDATSGVRKVTLTITW